MRFAFGIEYEGTRYYGWQRQEKLETIQGVVEAALSQVANHPVEVIAAGRTDKGVHAAQQIAHFDTTAHRSTFSWMSGCNRYLPEDMRILWVKEVPETFHARFGAQFRRYRYVIYNRRERPGLQRQFVSWIFQPLDFVAMSQAALLLRGTHDFAAFRGADCQAKTTTRTILDVSTQVLDDHYFVLDICANGFLLHMVRNIVGVLLEIGMHKQKIEWIVEVLNSKKRTMGGVTASEKGLFFIDAGYAEVFDLPKHAVGPWFLKLKS